MFLFFPSLVTFMDYDTETVGLYGLEANSRCDAGTSMQDVRKVGDEDV
jgi:hypothetical protein